MKRVLLLTCPCSIALLACLVSFSPAPGKSLTVDVLNHANQFRRSKGLTALSLHEDLNAIAEKHSSNMAKGRVGFGHGGFNKRYHEAKRKIAGFNGFAENVAYGATSGKEVVTLWKNSPGHRRNMLGQYKYTGIGMAKDRKGRIYYTQVFAR
ncbi:MAG: CAP domain-containing protein [Chitinophagaceae bacterium]|nr:CAP domain-containing protein [Chitinophagaceae bacterium]